MSGARHRPRSGFAMRRGAWFLTAALALAPSTVSAQPSEGTGKSAVEIGMRGIELYEDGAWAEALEQFEQANAQSHSPVFLLYAARCQRNLDRLLQARTTYEQFVDKDYGEDIVHQWRQAQLDGRAELAALERDIPTLRIAVVGTDASPQIAIDGEPAAQGEWLELDPGDYQVTARAGASSRERTVTLSRGDRNIELELDLSADAPIAPPPSETSPAGSDGPNGWGIAALAVGGAALAAGGVFGGIALGRSSDAESAIDELCGGNRDACDPAVQSQVEDERSGVHTFADLSTGFFIGGAVLTSLGVVLLITDPGGNDNAGDVGLSLGSVSVGQGPAGSLRLRF